MSSFGTKYAARLPIWVIVGALLGIAAGVVLGDDVTTIKPIGTTYVLLMEVVVFPYIICTLLHGLGSLSPATALKLFQRGWAIFVLVWAVTFFVIFLLTFAIPAPPPPSYIDARTDPKGLDLLELLIPANPFADLVRNHLPAIVVFSVIFGIAMQRIEKKEAFLSTLDLIRKASVTIWGWVVMLAPFGVFALFASTIGILKPDQLAGLSLYLALIVLGTVILAFWALPSLVSALCPLSSREVLRELQGAFVIALVTTLSVAALPYIQRATEKLAERFEIGERDRTEALQTTIAISYPLGQLGNFFIWLFILFAAFYYRVDITIGDQLLLPLIVLLSGIGSPSSSIDAVASIGTWLGMPREATELYVETMAISRYGQVLASVMGFAFLCLLVTLNFHGKLRLRLRPLARSATVSVAILVAVSIAGQYVQRHVIGARTAPYLLVDMPEDVTRNVVAIIEKPGKTSAGTAGNGASGAAGEALTTLDRIQRRGEIRVGYNPHVIPFSYHNRTGDLVGFDIAYMYRLARDLGVRLRLVPFEWRELASDLEKRRFDIAVSGIYVTATRLRNFDISNAYFSSPVALIVRAKMADRLLTRKAIAAQSNFVVAVFDDPVLVPLTKRIFPNATIKVLPSYAVLDQHNDVDAAIWTLEQAKAWAATRADYTVVVPRDLGGRFLIGYLMPKGSTGFQKYVNYWLQLQRANGFEAAMSRLWMEAKPPLDRKPRRSLFGLPQGPERK